MSLIYNLTISPTFYWRDSAEFVNTAFSFGIAHPAGFPAYSTISKLFTFIPLSDISMRINYVSMFFAIVTFWISFCIIIELINICFKNVSSGKASLAAMIGILILGSSVSYWWVATTSEVYTMNCFFLSFFFLIAIKWYQTGKLKYLLLASFIFGISIAVYGANLLFAPALFVFFFLIKGWKPLNQLIIAVAFFLLGYSVNLYLPVRSIMNPPFDWGDTETFRNYFYHITDKKDAGLHFYEFNNLILLFKSFKTFIQMQITEVSIIGLVLTLVGLISHFRIDKKSFFLLASIGFINTTFFLTTLTEISKNGSLFLASSLIFTFWIGLGIYVLIAESDGYIFKFKYKNLVIPLSIVFIIYSFVKDYQSNNRSDYYLPRDHSSEMFFNVEQNSIIFTNTYYFIFRYLKDMEFLRPDVSIILLSDIARPDLFNQVTRKRYPLLDFPSFDSKRENQHEFMQALISKNIYNKPIYWNLKRDLTKYNYQYLIPGIKFLMRFSSQKVDTIPRKQLEAYFLDLKKSMHAELNNDHFFLDNLMGVRSYYYAFLINFSDYLMKKEMYQSALSFLELALTITDPENEDVLNLKGICYMNSGNLMLAEKIFMKLFKKNRDDYENTFNLALLYFKKRDMNKSKDFLKKTMLLDANLFSSYLLLGLIDSEEGKYDKSIKEIKYAIEKAEFIPDKKRMQVILEKIKKLKEKNDSGAGSVQPPEISIP